MHVWKKTFLSAFVAQVLSILGFSFALPFLPFFIAELGVDNAGDQAFWAGVILAAAGVTFVIFSPIWGILADRFGRKSMLCRAMFGGTVVLMLMSYVQTLSQLAICRLMQGAFSGTIAASVALVASVVPRERSGFTLGMMQTAVFIGSTVGPFFGGIVADAFGYRAAFRGGAMLCLLGGLIIYYGTNENFTPPDRTENTNDMSFRAILLSKGFLLAVVIMFGVQFGNTMINPSFPLVIQDIKPNADNINSITGSIMAASALAGAISAALMGYLGDRIGHRRILIWACGLAGLASIGHFWANSLKKLLLARVLFGLTIASMLPAANAMINNIIDQKFLGKAYGLSSSISMIGVALGPFVGGYLARRAGLRVPFLVTAGVQFSLCLFIFFSVRKTTAPEVV